ncbi:hypothetical protein EVAR_96024_1 [Eumeta japonica]|uniref:Uncharacterized protein n=1 Tax=Eumeta variegata TaxID=151549 RepID=A0A4C1XFB0_EUMVA|nr:hypothetical protein EVAR_96024_1 [Eumeta japonica]
MGDIRPSTHAIPLDAPTLEFKYSGGSAPQNAHNFLAIEPECLNAGRAYASSKVGRERGGAAKILLGEVPLVIPSECRSEGEVGGLAPKTVEDEYSFTGKWFRNDAVAVALFTYTGFTLFGGRCMPSTLGFFFRRPLQAN